MKTILPQSRFLVFVFLLANLFFVNVSFGQIVMLDQADLDYAPGETVHITGSGWQPGETVMLEVANLTNPDVDCGPVTPQPHESWTIVADNEGNFTASWYVNDCELGADLLLGALGQTSGFTYEVFFTDAISLTPFTIGSQTGVLTSGTAGTVTYNSSMKISGAGSPVTINLGITGLPTGVSFSPASVASSNANPYNFTLTLTTTALTPSGTFPFVVTASGTDVNTATQTGTLVVNASCIPPAAPSVNTPLTYCQGSSADVLSATGANLLWYTTATGGTGSATAPTPSTALQGTVSYYVSQTIDCESPRAKIDVVVNGINPGTIGKGAVQPGPGCGTLDPGITSISTAASGSGALSYIWQQSTNGGTDWSTISSETSSQYNPPSLTTTTYYKRIVTSLLNGVICSAESNVLIYEVNPLPIVASILPGGTTNVCVGGTLQLTNATSGGVWSSANTGIATVDTNGLVTGITFGDVSISYTITDVNTGCSKSANKTVHVLALPYAPIAIDYSGIYDGVSHSGSATINSGETIDWYTTATGQTATVAPVGTNVGTYSAYAEARNITTGCKSTTRTLVTVTISKANPTVVVTPYNVTYDGHVHTATYTISGVNGEIGATVGTINVTGTTHTDAGTYTGDAWSFTGASNYNDANGTVDNAIGKANPTVVVTPYNITYDGHAHTATYTISGVNGEIGATVGTINVTGTTHTNAGTYTGDAWSFTGASNYNDANGTVDNAIGKANPTVVVTPYNVTYDGAAHTATYTISGVNGEIGATVGTINVTGTTHTNAGTYTGDVWSFTGASNYNNTNGTVNDVIGKANPTVVVTPYNVTYDGQAHTATYTISGVNGENGVTVGTIDVTATTHTNAGTYAGDAWSFTGASNYNDANGTVDNAIGKANPTVVVTPYNVTYDGAAHTATYTISGVNGENGVTVGTIDVTATTHTNAGTYAGDAWSFTGASNYNDANGTVDNAIGKANPTVVVTPYNVTYDGAAHTATYTISGVNGESGVTVGTIDVTATTHTNAGTYTGDAWSFIGASNYNNTSGTVNDVISKAPTTVAFTFGNLIYDGNPKDAIATATGAGGLNQDLTVTYVGTGATVYGPSTEAPSLAGTYSASANFVETANYLASNKVQGFTILAASTTTTLTLSAPSVRYMDNITLTAKITPVNAASALTGKVYFKINGHNYGSADVVPIQGSGDGSVQAQLIVQVSEMPNVPSTATYSVVAEFVSTNDNYSGSSKTEQLNVRPRNADPFNATGMYTGDIFAWTTSTSTSTATITLAAVLKDNNIPKGDLRGAKVTFYLVNGSSLTPISSAQNIAVGLIDATDGSVGAASAIVQLNIGSQNAQSFHVAVGVSGAYTNNPFDAKSQCIVTVSKPVTGGYIVGGGKILNNNSAGLIKGHAGLCTDYEFDIQYTKSGTNPKGKVKIFVRSYYDKNGLLDSNIHKYIITSTAISLLNVGAPNATGTFSSKANLDEQLEDGSIVAIEGGATLQLLAYQNNCTQQLAITFYRKAGGIWFSSNWNATSTKTVLQDVTSNPKSCVSVAGGGSCSTSTLTARVDSMNLKQDIEVQEETTVEPTTFNVIAYLNPTVSVFTIEVAGNSTENIQVLVYDSAGRLLKVIDRKDGEIIQFGEDLPRGTYIAKITQGTESKTVNLIKK